MKRRAKSLLLLTAAAMMLVCSACGGNAGSGGTGEAYPTKPITVIVGNAAGGGSDVSARMIANYLPEYLNANVVVTNNGAGSGEAAFLEVANAAADGYTIGFFHGGQIMATVMRDTKYQMEDYKFIGQQTHEPRILAVRADDERFPDLDAYIQYAKDRPGELTVSDSGVGSSEHFATEAIMYYGEIKVTPVHTNGSSESRANLLGGHVDALSGALSEVVPQVQDGSVRILGITAEERHEMFPDIPTFKEKGIDAVIDVLRGFYCSADTPQEIVDTFSKAMEEASKNPEYIESMTNLSLPVSYLNSEDFTELVMETKTMFEGLLSDIGWEKQ